jgi:hypothetical protein
MTGLNVGDKIKVRYTEGQPAFEYTIDVEVTAICSLDEFKGRVERVFAVDGPGAPGEITGGHILILKGHEKTFKTVDIR